MSSNSQMNLQFNNGDGQTITISTELMVGAVVFFFMIIFLIFFIHLYANWRWGPAAAARRARSRLIFNQGQDPLTAPHRGLDPSVILSLPVSIYRSEDFKEGLECAVCLSELADGEKARLLPKCNHGFHMECIDMWFHSHSTCPLCRYPVGPETNLGARGGENPPPETIQAEGHPIELPNLPTNVLFWGTQDREISTGGTAASPAGGSLAAYVAAGSSSSSDINKPHGMLVIDIPRRMVNGFSSPASPLPSSRLPIEEMKSPAATSASTPASTRLKSIRRLLSREKRVGVVSPYCSPRGADIEQGLGGAGAGGSGTGIIPKSPTSL